jgi:hypothetical protein
MKASTGAALSMLMFFNFARPHQEQLLFVRAFVGSPLGGPSCTWRHDMSAVFLQPGMIGHDKAGGYAN